jgi:opacity protein-like surface antigen
MQRRIIRFLPLTVALALTAGLATEGAAQYPTDTTRSRTAVTSTRRIPVQKEGTTVSESPGTVATDSAARADSIAAAERARQDSIAMADRARQDSIAAAERARQEAIAAAERARQDSIARAEQMRRDSIAAAERARAELFRVGRFGGWYFNLGGGASIPMGDFDDLYGTGWNVTGSAGWHPTDSPLGIRFDVTYDRLNGESFPAGGPNELADAAVWAGLAEGTLRIPRALGLNPYVVAGGGVYRFSDYGSTGTTSIYGGSNESSTEWGWNAGGGLRFGWGFTSLFVEARYMSVGTPGDRAEWVPIILGITFR